MNRLVFLLLVSVCGSAALVALVVFRSPTLSFVDVEQMFASVFFVDSITVDGLKAKYARAARGDGKIRILIVPGHDNDSWGTEFRGVREADMTAAVGEELSRLLSGDSQYEPILVRTRMDYAKEFRDYFREERVVAQAFVANKKQVMKDLIKAGMIHRAQGVAHNTAPFDVVWKLYGLNRWANENRADMVLHLHFNDYPGRPYHREGRYNGFSIYIPEKQFSNSKASRSVAESLFVQFSKFYAASNFPLEDSGIVPDQDLIAIGAYNTLDAVGMLIEYGYIYEERFKDAAIRDAFLKELALQTYIGLNTFFGNTKEVLRRYPTTFLPHTWSTPFSQGVSAHPSVLSLQTALLFEALYPPEGNKRACPLTGSFGPCTTRAVALFQQKHGITPATGVAGELTLQKLNERYAR